MMNKVYFSESALKKDKPTFRQRTVHFVTGKMLWIAPRLTLRLADRLLATPVRTKPSADLPQDFVAEDLSVTSGTVKLYTAGDAQRVILFLHGWAGKAEDFNSVFESVRKPGVALVAFDQIAHGRSSGTTTNFFSFVATAREVTDHLRAQGKEVVAVVAHSMGGSTALTLPEEQNSRIPLVLIAPVLPFFESLALSVRNFGISEKWVEALIAKYSAHFGFTAQEIEPRTTFAKINNPLLLIHDRKDRFVPLDANRDLIPEKYRAGLIETEGLGHFRILRDPGVLSKIRDFLSQR